jgi:hypothetical protein
MCFATGFEGARKEADLSPELKLKRCRVLVCHYGSVGRPGFWWGYLPRTETHDCHVPGNYAHYDGY